MVYIKPVITIFFSTVARIQFKLPNGVSQNHRFDPEDTIAELYNYVIEELKTPYGSNVSLSTTFPSRILDDVSRDTSLRENGLVPSTTILILPRSRGTVSRTSGGIMDYFWLLLTPITAIWGMISSFMSGDAGGQQGNANTTHQNTTNSNSSYAGPSTSS